MQEKNKKEIEKISKMWQLQLNLEYENAIKNVRLSFKDIGPFCEHLAIDYFPGFVGGGSGGMGYDLINRTMHKAIEVKSCCTIQNAKCKKCGAKYNDILSEKCPNCGSTESKKMNDSRFGIQSKEFFDMYTKNIFEAFIFCHISEYKHDKSKKELTILVEWYIVDFKDEEIKDIQLEYFKNQLDYGKKDHANLLPKSFDFYKLCPMKISSYKIVINYENIEQEPTITDIDLNNHYPKVPAELMRVKDELPIFKKLKSYDVKTNTADSKDFTINMPYRKKSLGKERGNTSDSKLRNLIEKSIN